VAPRRTCPASRCTVSDVVVLKPDRSAQDYAQAAFGWGRPQPFRSLAMGRPEIRVSNLDRASGDWRRRIAAIVRVKTGCAVVGQVVRGRTSGEHHG